MYTMIDRREKKKDEPTPKRMKAEMGKRWGNRNSISTRMEIKGEDICRNVDRLGTMLGGKMEP